MDQPHLSLETIAKWLSGRLEHDRVCDEIAPHLFKACPVCRQAHEEILRCQKEVGHWDELIAVQEAHEALGLYEDLASSPFAEQLRKVEVDESFHQWGLCQLLLAKSMGLAFSEPGRSLELAELGARITRFLGDAYDPTWVRDLRARALAYVANALRVLGELCGAEAYMRLAEDCLAESTTGNLLVQAEILDLRCSLLRDLRRWPEALDACSLSADLYEQSGDRRGLAKAMLQKARVFSEVGEVEPAVALLRKVPAALDHEADSDLVLCARFNLLCGLTKAGLVEEAEGLVSEVQALVNVAAEPLKAVHLVWAEGQIHALRGRLEPAEAAFRRAQGEFLDRQMAYDAALVSLDLAILLAQMGRSAELKCLALELMAVFESREIHREAMATLLMFQEACRDELLTVELAKQLAQFLRADRRQAKIE